MINLQSLLEAAITAEYGDTPARAELELDLAANITEVVRLGEIILAKDAAYAALQTELDGVRQANATLGEANRQLQDVIDSLTAQGEAKDAEITKLNDLLVKMDNAAAEHVRLIAAQTNTIRMLEARIKELEAGNPPEVPEEPEEPPPPPPPASEFPTAATTGAKGTLTAYTGPYTISAANVTIENKILTKPLLVTGRGFKMKNCSLKYSGNWGIDAEGAGPIELTDCTIVGPGTASHSTGAILAYGTFLRCDISQAEHLIVVKEADTLIQDCYLHDGNSPGQNGQEPHIGGVSLKGGNKNVTVRHNTIIGKDTSCIFLQDYFGPIDNVLLDNNKCLGTPGYMIYVEGRFGNGTSNVRVTNNVMKKGFYGYFSVASQNLTNLTFSGNVGSVSGNAPYSPVNG